MKSSTLKLLLTYKYSEEPVLKLLCARMLEDAFRRREDVQVFHTDDDYNLGEIDVVFNTLPLGDPMPGKLTAWWDIEACSFHKPEYFNSDIVLAPYSTGEDDVYPEGKTYLFPFATDPNHFHAHDVDQTYDVGFVGREEGNRTRRVEYLDELTQHVNLLRTNHIERGEPVSRLLSQAKVLIQVSGDACGGVMETRFFEYGLIGPLAADMTATNRRDMEWAAEPDYHFIAFETQDEMIEKIQRMLADDAARHLMFERAWKNYMARHAYDVRAREFLETIGFLKGPGLLDFHERHYT